MKNAPTIWSKLNCKVEKINVDKLLPVPLDLSKLSDAVKNYIVKEMFIMIRSKILKIKYLTLLT